MTREFFDPPWEQINMVLVDAATLRRAEHRLLSCEGCNPEDAEFPFDNVLHEITGNDATVKDYVLAEPAKCPRCKADVLEKTLVAWFPGGGGGKQMDNDPEPLFKQRPLNRPGAGYLVSDP